MAQQIPEHVKVTGVPVTGQGRGLPCRGLRGLSLRETWRCRLSNSVRLVAVRREHAEPADSRYPPSLTGVHDTDSPDLPDLLRGTCTSTGWPLHQSSARPACVAAWLARPLSVDTLCYPTMQGTAGTHEDECSLDTRYQSLSAPALVAKDMGYVHISRAKQHLGWQPTRLSGCDWGLTLLPIWFSQDASTSERLDVDWAC